MRSAPAAVLGGAAQPAARAEEAAAEAPTSTSQARKREVPSKVVKRKGNEPPFDIESEQRRILGVDATTLYGIDVMTIQTVLAEVGPDLSAWKTGRYWSSWLNLAPRRDVTAGRIIRHTREHRTNRVGNAFRMAAQSLIRSQSYMGARFRYLRAKLGGLKGHGRRSGLPLLPAAHARPDVGGPRYRGIRASKAAARIGCPTAQGPGFGHETRANGLEEPSSTSTHPKEVSGEAPKGGNSFGAVGWTATQGMVALALPMLFASAVTPDGTMAAGGDSWWKTSGQAGIFGPFPGNQDQTQALGLSGTSQTVAVGGAIKGSGPFGPTFHAFRWTPVGGLPDLVAHHRQ